MALIVMARMAAALLALSRRAAISAAAAYNCRKKIMSKTRSARPAARVLLRRRGRAISGSGEILCSSPSGEKPAAKIGGVAKEATRARGNSRRLRRLARRHVIWYRCRSASMISACGGKWRACCVLVMAYVGIAMLNARVVVALALAKVAALITAGSSAALLAGIFTRLSAMRPSPARN